MKNIAVALASLMLCSCSVFSAFDGPRSEAEIASGYAYIPLNPSPVSVQPGEGCFDDKYDSPTVRALSTLTPSKTQELVFKPLLQSFPDNAVRISQEQIFLNGKSSYGPASVEGSGQDFKVTADFISFDTTSLDVYMAKQLLNPDGSLGDLVSPFAPTPAGLSARYLVEKFDTLGYDELQKFLNTSEYKEVSIPAYIGVGLRASARVRSIGSSADISGLGVIGAEAEAGRLSGTLVVQTLGINGRSISAALPIQSELNRTTVQNAIVSIGSIKALLYEDETTRAPRVVGLYLPFPGDEALVNTLVTVLADEPLPWQRPCIVNPNFDGSS